MIKAIPGGAAEHDPDNIASTEIDGEEAVDVLSGGGAGDVLMGVALVHGEGLPVGDQEVQDFIAAGQAGLDPEVFGLLDQDELTNSNPFPVAEILEDDFPKASILNGGEAGIDGDPKLGGAFEGVVGRRSGAGTGAQEKCYDQKRGEEREFTPGGFVVHDRLIQG